MLKPSQLDPFVPPPIRKVVTRGWGTYEVISEYTVIESGIRFKHKVLTVNPHSSLSLQRHKNRMEIWYVISGKGFAINYIDHDHDQKFLQELTPGQTFQVNASVWHMLVNDTDKPLVIHETQIGSECVETDIERAHEQAV